MLQELISNPIFAIVVFLVAIGLSKILKLGMKIIKWVILIGIAYIIITALHIF